MSSLPDDYAKAQICLGIAVAEIRDAERSKESGTPASVPGQSMAGTDPEFHLNSFSDAVHSLVGVLGILRQDVEFGGFLPRLTSNFRNCFMATLTTEKVIGQALQIMEHIRSQLYQPDGQGRLVWHPFNLDGQDTNQAKVRQFQFAICLLAQLGLFCEAEAATAGASDDAIACPFSTGEFGHILKEFFSDLLQMYFFYPRNSAEKSLAREQVSKRLQILNFAQKLTVNRYLRALFLDLAVDCLFSESIHLQRVSNERPNLAFYLEYLVEACAEVTRNLRTEMFHLHQASSKKSKAEEIAASSKTEFPPLPFIKMKRPEKLALKETLERWMSALTTSTRGLLFLEPIYLRKVQLFQSEIQEVLENMGKDMY